MVTDAAAFVATALRNAAESRSKSVLLGEVRIIVTPQWCSYHTTNAPTIPDPPAESVTVTPVVNGGMFMSEVSPAPFTTKLYVRPDVGVIVQVPEPLPE